MSKKTPEELIQQARQLVNDHMYKPALRLVSEAGRHTEVDPNLLNTALYGSLIENLLEECDKYIETGEGDPDYLKSTLRSHYSMFKRYSGDDPFKIKDEENFFKDLSEKIYHLSLGQLTLMTSTLQTTLEEFNENLERVIRHGKRLGYNTNRLEKMRNLCTSSRQRLLVAEEELSVMVQETDDYQTSK